MIEDHPVLDLAARKTVIATECLCASVSYWNLIGETLHANRKIEARGMAHACELETSIYLYLTRTMSTSLRLWSPLFMTRKSLFLPRSHGRGQSHGHAVVVCADR